MLSNEEILEAIDGMSPQELDELRDAYAARFRVVCPVRVAPARPVEAVVEEQQEYSVWLKEAGPGKVNVIKLVRELTGLGLKESKDVVDKAPSELRGGLDRHAAEVLLARLLEARATGEIR